MQPLSGRSSMPAVRMHYLIAAQSPFPVSSSHIKSRVILTLLDRYSLQHCFPSPCISAPIAFAALAPCMQTREDLPETSARARRFFFLSLSMLHEAAARGWYHRMHGHESAVSSKNTPAISTACVFELEKRTEPSYQGLLLSLLCTASRHPTV